MLKGLFNIAVVQAYTPTSNYDDNKIEEFYDQLQNVFDQTLKDILVVQGDWNSKVSSMLVKMTRHLWTLCDDDKNERGLCL